MVGSGRLPTPRGLTGTEAAASQRTSVRTLTLALALTPTPTLTLTLTLTLPLPLPLTRPPLPVPVLPAATHPTASELSFCGAGGAFVSLLGVSGTARTAA